MSRKNVLATYNQAAEAYARQFKDELSQKHFDRMILTAFAKENGAKGKMIDLGCGPGQTTQFLSQAGVSDILGVDLSDAMISEARKLYPALKFETADMLELPYEENSFDAALAFYAIVNLNEEQVALAFAGIHRILKPGSEFLFSFHVGDKVLTLEEFLGNPVNIDFHFYETAAIIKIAEGAGFTVIDAIERQPYETIEHPSARGYVWVKAN